MEVARPFLLRSGKEAMHSPAS